MIESGNVNILALHIDKAEGQLKWLISFHPYEFKTHIRNSPPFLGDDVSE